MIKRITIIIFFSIQLVIAQSGGNQQNRFMLGQSYEQAGDLEKAKLIYEELYITDPANVQYFHSLNKVFLLLKDYSSSERILTDRIKISPYDITLYGMLGSTYHLMGDEGKAFKIWDDALNSMGNNSSIFRTIANYAIERRAFSKAIEIFKRGQKSDDANKSLSYEIANLYSLTMQYREAAEELCEILLTSPNQLATVESRFLQFTNKPDALKTAIAVVGKHADSHLNFEYLLARLYIEAQDFERAFEIYSSIDKKNNGGGSKLVSFALFLYNDKKYDVAEKVYNLILTRYSSAPFVPEVKLGLAKTKEAVLYSTSAVDMETWKPYSTIKQNRLTEAGQVIELYEELAKLFPKSEASYEAYLRIGWLYFYKYADNTKAAEYFQKIIDEVPHSQFSPSAYEGLGEISILQGDLDRAVKFYTNIVENQRAVFDRRNSARFRLAQCFFFMNKTEKSKALLAEIIKSLNDNTANDAIEFSLLLNTAVNDSSNLVKFAEAEYLSAQQKYVQANDNYKTIANDPNAFVLKNISGIRQAEMLVAVDDFSNAIVLLQEISAEGEKNIYADKALYLLARIYQFGLKDQLKAVESYEKLLAKFPSSLYLDEARNEILKLKEKIS